MEPAILVISKVSYNGYYKCYPFNRGLALVNRELALVNRGLALVNEVLVPYKPDLMKFNKNFVNKFILITITDLEKKIGKIIETIGPVNDLNSFYRYQLYCYKLVHPTGFNKLKCPLINYQKFKKLNREIYTIDPISSKDLDDAFSIIYDNNESILSIYITNPYETDLKCINNVSTIYCDNPLNMIPKDFLETFSFFNETKMSLHETKVSLHETKVSLKNDKKHIALTLDLHIKNGKIIKENLYNSVITIYKNLDYDTNEKIAGSLITLINEISNKKINDTHEAIEYLMVYINTYCAKILLKNNTGIFRYSSEEIKEPVNDVSYKVLDNDLLTFLNYEAKSIYSTTVKKHKMFNDYYVHISSPIRRLVDILNMMKINQILDPDYIFDDEFYNRWSGSEEGLNDQYNVIKKIENQLKLLKVIDSDLEYDGYVIEEGFNETKVSFNETKVSFNETKVSFKIYLPQIKAIYSYKSKDSLDLYSKHKFKCYIFDNESTYKRKIKLMKIY